MGLLQGAMRSHPDSHRQSRFARPRLVGCKSRFLAAIGAFALISAAPLFGESPFERELKQLTEQRDKDLAAARPINLRYQDLFNQLLRRATQSNDFDTALKIKGEIQKLPPASADAQNALSKALRDSKWTWGPPSGIVAFNADGTMTSSAGWSSSWEVTAPKTVTLRDGTARQTTLHFDDRFSKFSGADYSGTIKVKGTRK